MHLILFCLLQMPASAATNTSLMRPSLIFVDTDTHLEYLTKAAFSYV